MADDGPCRCIDSPDGFVDGVPCVAIRQRMYSNGPGQGIEAEAVLGELDGATQIADRSIPFGKLEAGAAVPLSVLYVPEPGLFGAVIVVDVGSAEHPPDGALALIKIPVRPADSDDSEHISIRTDSSASQYRQSAVTIIAQSRSQRRWRDVRQGYWYLVARSADGWVLLN